MKCCRAFAVVLLLAPGFAALAEDVPPSPEVDEVVRRLQSAYRNLETLQAEFTQSLHSLALSAPQRESGTLYLRRPAQMRWEDREPEHKLAVADGERTWLYIPAEGQVFVGSMAELRRSAALALLLGDGLDLKRDFTVQAVLDEQGEVLPDSLSLAPLRLSEEFERIELTLGKNDLPRRIVVHGVAGEVMDYRLRRVRTGVALQEALFRFQPPEGVEMVPAE